MAGLSSNTITPWNTIGHPQIQADLINAGNNSLSSAGNILSKLQEVAAERNDNMIKAELEREEVENARAKLEQDMLIAQMSDAASRYAADMGYKGTLAQIKSAEAIAAQKLNAKANDPQSLYYAHRLQQEDEDKKRAQGFFDTVNGLIEIQNADGSTYKMSRADAARLLTNLNKYRNAKQTNKNLGMFSRTDLEHMKMLQGMTDDNGNVSVDDGGLITKLNQQFSKDGMDPTDILSSSGLRRIAGMAITNPEVAKYIADVKADEDRLLTANQDRIMKIESAKKEFGKDPIAYLNKLGADIDYKVDKQDIDALKALVNELFDINGSDIGAFDTIASVLKTSAKRNAAQRLVGRSIDIDEIRAALQARLYNNQAPARPNVTQTQKQTPSDNSDTF